MLLVADPKMGKTWSLLDLALSVAHGVSWWGMHTVQGKVLYINLELFEDTMQARLNKLREYKKLTSLHANLTVWNLRGFKAEITNLVNTVLGVIKKGGDYKLIVIDPLYKTYGERDENSNTEMAQVMAEIERLVQQTGAGVVIAHHYSKGDQGGKKVSDLGAGAGVITREIDVKISCTALQHEENAYRVDVMQREYALVEPFGIRWNERHCSFSRDGQLELDATVGRQGRPKTYTVWQLVGLLRAEGYGYSEWFKKAEEELQSSLTTFKARRKQALEEHLVHEKDHRYYKTELSGLRAKLESAAETKVGNL
jgi:hypothetical protein